MPRWGAVGLWVALVGLLLWIRDAGLLSWLGLALLGGGLGFATYQFVSNRR